MRCVQAAAVCALYACSSCRCREANKACSCRQPAACRGHAPPRSPSTWPVSGVAPPGCHLHTGWAPYRPRAQAAGGRGRAHTRGTAAACCSSPASNLAAGPASARVCVSLWCCSLLMWCCMPSERSAYRQGSLLGPPHADRPRGESAARLYGVETLLRYTNAPRYCCCTRQVLHCCLHAMGSTPAYKSASRNGCLPTTQPDIASMCAVSRSCTSTSSRSGTCVTGITR